jgi:hypothetical protein
VFSVSLFVKPSYKFYIFALFFFLNFTSLASSSNTNIITNVAVAEFKDEDENIASPLTVGVLKKHGIMAGGGGLSGGMTIGVPPNQEKQAHKILQDELAGLSQKQRDSFDITWDWQKGNGRALYFLKDIPSLRQVTPDMSESGFVDFLKRQKIDYTQVTWGEQITYRIKPTLREVVFVIFKDGQCFSVLRISGYLAEPQ